MVPERKIISGVKFGYRMYLDHRVGVKFLDLPRADIHDGLQLMASWTRLWSHSDLWSLPRDGQSVVDQPQGLLWKQG